MNGLKFVKEMDQDLKRLRECIGKRRKILWWYLFFGRYDKEDEMACAIDKIQSIFRDFIIAYEGFAREFIAHLPEGIICERHSMAARATIFAVEGTDFDTKKIEVTKKERYVIFHPKGKTVSPEEAEWVVKYMNKMPLLLAIPR